ncbi:MAG: hypothetical protein K2G88_08875 [Oscillospiraceae bacterium]|nr:hypothetical protein [Oscillospiraceae bacterium]
MVLNQASNIMLGNQEVQRVYLGETLVWERKSNKLFIPKFNNTLWGYQALVLTHNMYRKDIYALFASTDVTAWTFTATDEAGTMHFNYDRTKSPQGLPSGVWQNLLNLETGKFGIYNRYPISALDYTNQKLIACTPNMIETFGKIPDYVYLIKTIAEFEEGFWIEHESD